MMNYINNYRKMSFEEKAITNTFISIIFNGLMAVLKFILAIFNGFFFIVAGIINVLVLASKLHCYLGVKYPNLKSFKYRNKMTSILLILAGVQYVIYMLRLIIFDIEIMDYGIILGITIALVSFIELSLSIKGCFNACGKGHYFRNIKLISLSSALTAIVLTEVALLSFSHDGDANFINGVVGSIVGVIIILIGIYMQIAPSISIIDKIHNVYKFNGENRFLSDKVEFKLTKSKF